MIDLRIGEDFKAKQRRSMAVGPYEDLPPHLRNHLVSYVINPSKHILFHGAYSD